MTPDEKQQLFEALLVHAAKQRIIEESLSRIYEMLVKVGSMVHGQMEWWLFEAVEEDCTETGLFEELVE